MPATLYVVVRFVAKPGKEEALKGVLSALIAPSRREIGCFQYDVLVSPTDPREFGIVERWEGDKALDQHMETEHFKTAMRQLDGILDSAAEIRRYSLL